MERAGASFDERGGGAVGLVVGRPQAGLWVCAAVGATVVLFLGGLAVCVVASALVLGWPRLSRGGGGVRGPGGALRRCLPEGGPTLLWACCPCAFCALAGLGFLRGLGV